MNSTGRALFNAFDQRVSPHVNSQPKADSLNQKAELQQVQGEFDIQGLTQEGQEVSRFAREKKINKKKAIPSPTANARPVFIETRVKNSSTGNQMRVQRAARPVQLV